MHKKIYLFNFSIFPFMMKQKDIKKIFERNLHLCQQVLCDREVAKKVNEDVTKRIERQLSENADIEVPKLITFSYQVIDMAIDDYFRKMVHDIQSGIESEQNKLYKMLQKRFLTILENKMRKDVRIFSHCHDKYEILQRTLITIHQKINEFQSDGLFIQWAQKILDNKYKEYRREVLRQKSRLKSYSYDEFEKHRSVRLEDVIQSRKEAKEIRTDSLYDGVQNCSQDNEDHDPFSNDPFKWGPMVLLEYRDMKKHLIKIIKKMKEPCNRVFLFLLSEGGRRNIQELFPEMNRSNIDLIIFRCRKKLKYFASREEIYEMF